MKVHYSRVCKWKQKTQQTPIWEDLNEWRHTAVTRTRK